MKQWILLCLAIACMVCFSSCGCSKQPTTPAESTRPAASGVPDDGADEKQDGQEPPPLGAGPGVYDQNGLYTHPETIDGEPVTEYGHYQTDIGGSKTIPGDAIPGNTVSGDNGTDDKGAGENNTGENGGGQAEPIAPAEDLYKDACERTYHSLEGFTAFIDFDFYADGQHDAYQYTLTFDPATGRYTATEKTSGQSKTYAPGEPSASAHRTDPAFVRFCRTCSFVPPLLLTRYNFDTTKEGTVVSTITAGEEHRQALLAASNLFEGFETYDETALSLGSLYYTAYIDANGNLTGTNMQYTLHLNDSEIDITAMVNIRYE
ncbi:MAG: hypothetical protein HFE78_00500 [Clostridiales bacterium]|nr:hypothetical protein [Clostridiales bacterium]